MNSAFWLKGVRLAFVTILHGVPAIGTGKSSDGSRLIIAAVTQPDPHLILEVRDQSPIVPLVAYRRAVISVI